MAQWGVNEAKLEIYGDLQGPEEGRVGGRRPPAGGGHADGSPHRRRSRRDCGPDRPPAGTGTGAKRREVEMAILNIVLVEPRIPQNVGNIARTCAATGARLHLVEPMAFTIDDTKLKRAGLDYWKYLDVTTYPSLVDFMERHKDEQEKMYYFTTKAQHIYTEVRYPDGCWLLFGREDAGLPEELLVQHPARCLRFPMRQGLRSLNLSNSVAIGVYEALRQWDFPQLQNEGQLHRLKWE